MPTISGLRRRGYTPESIRNFADRIGVAKRENIIDVGLLEFFIREDLNKKANRVMAVLDPIKVIITNYPEDKTEILIAQNNPEDEKAGTRELSFSREIFIERDDFMENAPNKFFRLKPGGEVRLRYAYFIKYEKLIKDENGNIKEIHCSYDPESKGGKSPDGRKVKGTIHWVDSKNCIDAELRLYDRLFTKENPEDLEENKTYLDYLNPDSLKIVNAKLEKSLETAKIGEKYQFERKGYFCVDKDSNSKKLVFNRTVDLKDSWAKIVKNG
jgi:glutaminyl-tRNA synthetase